MYGKLCRWHAHENDPAGMITYGTELALALSLKARTFRYELCKIGKNE
jgi:hypothetical protein